MAEYWVSQAKKFCEFCKCWIADNKPSRDFHEKGKRHQDNVKKKIEEVRKSAIKKARADEEMDDSLREMNENALKALKKDLKSNPSLASQYGIKLKQKEPEKLPEYGPAPRPESSTVDEESAKEEFTSATGEPVATASESASEGTWHMAVSEQGYPYYWNDVTSEVSWIPPPAYEVQEANANSAVAALSGQEPTTEEIVTPLPKTEETLQQEAKDSLPEEPEAKKPKLIEAESLVVADIPLPGDIPLPPPPGTEDEAKKELSEEGEKEEDNTKNESDNEACEPRQPRSSIAYGSWEQIPEPQKMEDIDLGLPQTKPEPAPVVVMVPEPKMKFREKTVSSLGSGPVFFKKPKKKMSAAQFLKRREADS